MKLNPNPRVNVDAETARWYREVATQVNAMAEGTQAAFYKAATSAPTTGTWAKGDFVLNSAPAELGTATAKYLVHGWRCTVSGTPGTWLQLRSLTGN
jgi:hypothetical protein